MSKIAKVHTVEELARRSPSANPQIQIDHRAHLSLQLIADTLIAILAEMQKQKADSPS